MKQLMICLCALFLTCQLALAQSKGDMSAGGLIGVETQTDFLNGNNATATTVRVAPEFSYFIIDNLRLTGMAAYEYSHYKGLPDVNSVYVGPSIAYYFGICDCLYYTPEFNIGFAYQNVSSRNFYGFSTGLKFLQLEFKPIPHIGISLSILSLDYTYLRYEKNNYSIDAGELGFKLALNPTIGFKIYF